MYFLVVAAFILALALLCFVRSAVLSSRGTTSGYDAGGMVLIVCMLLVTLLGFLVSAGAMVQQLSDLEDVRKFRNVETIYREKANALTAEFASYLAEQYPDHERGLYEAIGPDQVNVYLVRYPELRASDALMALVDHINELQSDVYAQRIAAEEALKAIRFRLRHPWFFQFMIPAE